MHMGGRIDAGLTTLLPAMRERPKLLDTYDAAVLFGTGTKDFLFTFTAQGTGDKVAPSRANLSPRFPRGTPSNDPSQRRLEVVYFTSRVPDWQP